MLGLKGISFCQLARIYKVHKSNFILRKHIPCPKYEKIIADILELNPCDIWPHRYSKDQGPNRTFKFHKNKFMQHRTIKKQGINGKSHKL